MTDEEITDKAIVKAKAMKRANNMIDHLPEETV